MSLTVYNEKIEEKYRIRDLIESSLEALEKPRPKNMLMKNLAADESVDPYAPSSSTTAFMDSLAGN